MLQKAIVTTVDYCTRYATQMIGIAALLGLVTAIYAAGHFAIDADVNKLISKELPWRQREVAFQKSFPPKEETILAVVDAPTSELATQATAALIQKLSGQKDHFRSIMEAGGGPFFQKNGLLFLPAEEVVGTTKKLGEAKPVIQALAQDSNLRGLTTALNYGLIGARMNHYTLDDFGGTLNMVSDTLDEAIAGRPASFSWRAMLNGHPPTPGERRRFIDIRPVLDYSALMPGKAATDAIRQAAVDLNIAGRDGARVRLTGPVAIADEEYATLQEGAFVNTTVTILVVLTILWLALRSFGDHPGGVPQSAGRPLHHRRDRTGAGGCAQPDFDSFRRSLYRAGRRLRDSVQRPLPGRASRSRRPPQGLAQHGAARGRAADACRRRNRRRLPVLSSHRLQRPVRTRPARRPRHDHRVPDQREPDPGIADAAAATGRTEGNGIQGLAPVDRFMERHRIPIIVGTGLVVAAGLPLLYWLQFDFNPLNLRSPKVESVATFLELRSDPAIGASSIYVLAANKEAADADMEKLSKLPEVSSVKTIENFIPADQQPKLAAIHQLATVLDPVLRPDPNKKPPTDADNVAALKAAVTALKQSAGTQSGRGATAAKRLAEDLANHRRWR